MALVRGMGRSTWQSPNEYVITQREIDYVNELSITDRDIASQLNVENQKKPRRIFMIRMFRRLYFELKRLLNRLTSRLVRIVIRKYMQFALKFLTVRNGKHFQFSFGLVQVLSLEHPKLAHILGETQADYWVLTRAPGQLLNSAVPHIREALNSSTASMWFGDSVNQRGSRYRRSKFSKLLLRQVDFFGPVVVVKTELLRQIDKSLPTELWPLIIGLGLPESSIELIPRVLGCGDVTISNLGKNSNLAVRLVEQELNASELNAQVTENLFGRRTVSYELKTRPKVSIIIPTRGTGNEGKSFVVDAVRSVISKSDYSNFEFVIVADEPTPQLVIDELDSLITQNLRWVRWTKAFNFSEKINLGAACSTGEMLLFLNDDIEVVSSGWISSMLSLIGVDGIDYVGALLFFEDLSLQHAGHFYAGGAGHIGFGEYLRDQDPNQLFQLDRVVSGVTAACSLVSKELFTKVGGFSPIFPGNYNDVDFSLKLSNCGSKIAVAGNARLYHFESKTRDASVQKSEIENLLSRWKTKLVYDELHRSA